MHLEDGSNKHFLSIYDSFLFLPLLVHQNQIRGCGPYQRHTERISLYIKATVIWRRCKRKEPTNKVQDWTSNTVCISAKHRYIRKLRPSVHHTITIVNPFCFTQWCWCPYKSLFESPQILQSLDAKALSRDDARCETHFLIQTLRVDTGVMWNKLYPSGHQGALVNEILWQWSLAAVNFVISATAKQQDEWLGTLHPTHLKGHRPHRWDGQKIYKLMGNGVKGIFICLAIGFGMATFRTS